MRTGTRRGIAHADTLHVAGATAAGTLCGRRPARNGYGPQPTLAAARERAKLQACRICDSCKKKAPDLSPIAIGRFRFDGREFSADPALVYEPFHEGGVYGADGPPGLHVTASTRDVLIEEIQEAIACNWIDFVEADEATLTRGQRLMRRSTMAVVRCVSATQEAEPAHG